MRTDQSSHYHKEFSPREEAMWSISVPMFPPVSPRVPEAPGGHAWFPYIPVP